MVDQIRLPSIDMERRNLMIKWHNSAPICKNFGMTLSYRKNNQAVITLPHNPKLDHGYGTVSGGTVATMMDHVGYFVLAQYMTHNSATIEMHVRYLEPFAQDDLYATGQVIRLGKTISVAQMDVFTNEERRIATGTASYIPISVPLTPQFLEAMIAKFHT